MLVDAPTAAATRAAEPGRYPRPRATVDGDRSKGWLKRVWPIVMARRLAFATAIILGLLATLATVAVPVTVGRGINAVDQGETPTPWVVALAGLAAARFILGYTYRFRLFKTAHAIENDLRNLIYEKLTELSFEYWDRTQSGQIISRANSDVRSIQMLLGFAPLIAMQFVMLVVALAVMVAIDLPLTLVAVAPMPFVFLVGVRLRNAIFPLSWVQQARQADVATIVDENIQGTRVVKAFAQEQRQVQLLADAARRLRWSGIELADKRARNAPVMEALPRLGLALVLLYGGILAIDGEIDVGQLVAFSSYVIILTMPFRMVGFLMLQWQRAGAAALRVFEVLDEQPAIVEPDDAVRLPDPQGRVVFDSVSFVYPTGDGTGVLDDVSFTVEAGETVAIVGATGSGKSSIARLIPRFYDAAGGTVTIDGLDVRTLALTDLRRAATIVPDDPFLFATSVRDNVAFACPDAPDHLVRAAIEDAAAADFVDDLPDGMSTVVGERGLTLSGGQRQRLALARALAADPTVLILNDATSAIDVAVETRIHDAIRRRRAGRTTILIAHRLSTIALADRVVLIENGRVVAEGRHHDLLDREPRYAAILADAEADPESDAGRSRDESRRGSAGNGARELPSDENRRGSAGNGARELPSDENRRGSAGNGARELPSDESRRGSAGNGARELPSDESRRGSAGNGGE